MKYRERIEFLCCGWKIQMEIHQRDKNYRLVTLSSSVSAHDGIVLIRSLNVFWAFTKQLNEVLFVLSADISVLKNTASLHIKFSVVGLRWGPGESADQSRARRASRLVWSSLMCTNPIRTWTGGHANRCESSSTGDSSQRACECNLREISPALLCNSGDRWQIGWGRVVIIFCQWRI